MFTYVYFIFRNEIINKSGSVYAKTKSQKQKQKQSYNERKKNSKAENKATREKSSSKWDVYKRNQREKKKIETIGNAIFIFMCSSFFGGGVGQIWKTNLPKFEFFIQKQAMYIFWHK